MGTLFYMTLENPGYGSLSSRACNRYNLSNEDMDMMPDVLITDAGIEDLPAILTLQKAVYLSEAEICQDYTHTAAAAEYGSDYS